MRCTPINIWAREIGEKYRAATMTDSDVSALALAMFRSFKADAFIERYGPVEVMRKITTALRRGSKDVWAEMK